MDFTDKQVEQVWLKATRISTKNETNGFRRDMCGAWIKKDKYGEGGKYGWEIDHIYPKSKAEKNGVPEELYNDVKNLQPLHHENNGPEGKGDDYPSFMSAKTSNGIENIANEKKFTVPQAKQTEIKNLFGL